MTELRQHITIIAVQEIALNYSAIRKEIFLGRMTKVNQILKHLMKMPQKDFK